ncbi:MAG TPA: TadE family protein [Abditibacteriaceae bacterium]|jgi:Flp pilus assembly protein TadG
MKLQFLRPKFGYADTHPSRKRGQAIVEMALVLPVLIALIIGIMEFGWMVKNSMQINNAAREGARMASIGNNTLVVATNIRARTQGIPVTVTQEYSMDNVTFKPLTNAGDANAAPPGALVRVTVNAQSRPLTGFIPYLNNRRLVVSAAFGRE